MNEKNIRAVIEVLRDESRDDIIFDMARTFYPVDKDHACLCIQGIALAAVTSDGEIRDRVTPENFHAAVAIHQDYADAFATRLGIHREDAREIAYGFGNFRNGGEVTRADAIRLLENLLETGVVDWQRAAEGVPT